MLFEHDDNQQPNGDTGSTSACHKSNIPTRRTQMVDDILNASICSGQCQQVALYHRVRSERTAKCRHMTREATAELQTCSEVATTERCGTPPGVHLRRCLR